MKLDAAAENRSYPLLVGTLLPMAFDFKGEPGGSVIIYGIVLLSLCAALLFCYEHWANLGLTSYEKMIGVAAALPCVLSVIPLMLGTVSLSPFIRTAIPYVFLIVGYYVGLTAFKVGLARNLLSILFVCSLISVIFNFVFILAINEPNFTLEDARYRIVSQFSYAAFLVASYHILCRRNLRVADIAAIDLVVFILLVSLTRSYLISLLAGLMFLSLPRTEKTIRSTSEKLVSRHRAALISVLSVIAVVVCVSLYLPGVMSNWQYRLLKTAVPSAVPSEADSAIQKLPGFLEKDISSLARIAEISSQMTLLTSDWKSILFGRGIGSPYTLSMTYYDLLAPIIPTEMEKEFTYAGHNFWVYSIFTNGVIAGLVLPICLLFVMGHGVLLARNRRFANLHGMSREVVVISLAYLASILVSTIGGNFLGMRAGSLIFGLFLGLLVASISHSRRRASSSMKSVEF